MSITLFTVHNHVSIFKLNLFTDKCSQLYSLLVVKMKNGPKMIKFISEADYGVSNWEPQAAAQMVHHQIVAERLSLPAVVVGTE